MQPQPGAVGDDVVSAHAYIPDEKRPPRATVGHMPFPGHRTVAVVWAKQEAARRREAMRQREMVEYGFDPESLKGGK